jgi:uncharacterized protein YyaL (SSP411 family)
MLVFLLGQSCRERPLCHSAMPSKAGTPGTAFPTVLFSSRSQSLLGNQSETVGFVGRFACFLPWPFYDSCMTDSTPGKPNRLIDETSPYLLQHAYNPVRWHPWDQEALQAAREQDRPIFLSIGYSACHWCHVMEHESFENESIAELMNRHFVNIKVDREERPDLDQIYMNSVMALTGRGGWPMSVFLTPDLKPFYGGTYWPPVSRMGMPGFRDVLEQVSEAWESRREQVLSGADELTAAIVSMGVPQAAPAQLSVSLLENAMRSLTRAADKTNGGFGSAPKFPHPMDLRLLLRAWKRFGSEDALHVVCHTLEKMAYGGIYDHLGGGFHRYSTDARWLVPHFEKMLYDNALLSSTYLEAFQATGNEEHARVVRETLDYVLREMTQPQGGFFSTQDADSEGVEGKFFVWSKQEILERLGSEEGRIFNDYFDVTTEGNWEETNILNRVRTHSEAAKRLGIDERELSTVLDRCKRKLFDARCNRIAPARDDKILVSWNGMMIAAMAGAARVLQEPMYAQAARQAADFILDNMRTADGRLLHAYKDGRARFNAYLDDYACLIDGLIEVYQATFEIGYLDEALKLSERMIEQFFDAASGGFFYTSGDHETLVVRNKDSQDNATPSGNGMAATALLKLARLCGNMDLEQKAILTLEMLSGQLAHIPMSGGQSLLAVDFLLGPAYEIVLAEGEQPQETAEILSLLHSAFLPNTIILKRLYTIDENEIPSALKPVLDGKSALENIATLYLCERESCREPVQGFEKVKSILSSL